MDIQLAAFEMIIRPCGMTAAGEEEGRDEAMLERPEITGK